MVPITVNETSAFAVLDSGADVSIISDNFFNKISNKNTFVLGKSSIPYLRGVSGAKLVTLGTSTVVKKTK